ncbi:MAG: restriction endonuclease subunit S, partial [Coriobacteriia bacterium]|nr:restriction endonuclease subunit S [Coriobacteriia bacterium]
LRPQRPGEYAPEFLAYYLTHVKRGEISRLGQGNSVVHLYGRDIARLEVSLPSLERQVAIATVLAIGQREIAALEATRVGYMAQRQGVARSLFNQGSSS